MILGAPALDPIMVTLIDFEQGKGQITIACQGDAFTASWGGMGDSTIRSFFCTCGIDYLMNNFKGRLHTKLKKAELAYMERIILATQTALREG